MKAKNLSYNVTKYYVENGIIYKTFIDLHLCNHNGVYHLVNSDKNLRITETEYDSVEDKAIKQLEALTGNTWENPYKPEDGYYTSEAIQAREDQKKREKRNEIIADYEKEIQKAENRKLVRLAVLDTGIPLKNVIYYNHTNNWNDYEEKVTQEQFDKFVKNITFKLK